MEGVFNGTFQRRGDVLQITGKSEFRFYDEFKDPVNLRIEVGGTPYVIAGEWEATFTAEVFKDENRSNYFERG